MKKFGKIFVGFILLHFTVNVYAQDKWGVNDSMYTLEQIDYLIPKKLLYQSKDSTLLKGWLKVETKSFVRFTHYCNGLVDGFEIEYDRKNLNRASYVSFYLKGNINFEINFDKELEIKSYTIYKPDLSDPTLTKTTYNFKKVTEKSFFYDPIGHFKFSVKTKLIWEELGKYYAAAINRLTKNNFSLQLFDSDNPFYSLRTDGFYCCQAIDHIDSNYFIRVLDKTNVLVVKKINSQDTLTVDWNKENVKHCRLEMLGRTQFQLKNGDDFSMNIQLIGGNPVYFNAKGEYLNLIFYPFN